MYFSMSRAVLAIQHSSVPEWKMYEQQLQHHDRDVLQLLGVHQQVGICGRFLCCRFRCVLCDLHLHLWGHGLHQQHLHQEPGIPQQLHAHQYWHLLCYHWQSVGRHLSAKEGLKLYIFIFDQSLIPKKQKRLVFTLIIFWPIFPDLTSKPWLATQPPLLGFAQTSLKPLVRLVKIPQLSVGQTLVTTVRYLGLSDFSFYSVMPPVYVEFGTSATDSIALKTTLGDTSTKTWNILARQIACTDTWK